MSATPAASDDYETILVREVRRRIIDFRFDEKLDEWCVERFGSGGEFASDDDRHELERMLRELPLHLLRRVAPGSITHSSSADPEDERTER